MNSRQRILKAVNFEKPDRIPIDLGGLRASGINAVVYHQLKQRLGINTPTKIHDVMQMLAEVELEVLDKLHCDVVPLDPVDLDWVDKDAQYGSPRTMFCGQQVYLPPTPAVTEEPNGDWTLRTEDGRLYARMPKDGYYFDAVAPTMSSGRIDPNKFTPPSDVSDETLDFMAQRGKYLFDHTDKAILGWGAGICLMGLSFVTTSNIAQGSLDEWLCMLVAEKETAHEMMARYVDAAISQLQLFHQAVGDYCFAWGSSDDSGTQKGCLISPQLYDEMLKPHYQRLCDWVHRHTNWKTFLHSCGSVSPYIDAWIDAGIDILNPVQISAAHMAPQELMTKFAGRIVFWGGGCDTQHVLPHATPEQVKENVRQNLSIFGRGNGGYVFNQVHNIQQDVPVENVEAMFQAAYEYGKLD